MNNTQKIFLSNLRNKTNKIIEPHHVRMLTKLLDMSNSRIGGATNTNECINNTSTIQKFQENMRFILEKYLVDTTKDEDLLKSFSQRFINDNQFVNETKKNLIELIKCNVLEELNFIYYFLLYCCNKMLEIIGKFHTKPIDEIKILISNYTYYMTDVQQFVRVIMNECNVYISKLNFYWFLSKMNDDNETVTEIEKLFTSFAKIKEEYSQSEFHRNPNILDKFTMPIENEDEDEVEDEDDSLKKYVTFLTEVRKLEDNIIESIINNSNIDRLNHLQDAFTTEKMNIFIDDINTLENDDMHTLKSKLMTFRFKTNKRIRIVSILEKIDARKNELDKKENNAKTNLMKEKLTKENIERKATELEQFNKEFSSETLIEYYKNIFQKITDSEEVKNRLIGKFEELLGSFEELLTQFNASRAVVEDPKPFYSKENTINKIKDLYPIKDQCEYIYQMIIEIINDDLDKKYKEYMLQFQTILEEQKNHGDDLKLAQESYKDVYEKLTQFENLLSTQNMLLTTNNQGVTFKQVTQINDNIKQLLLNHDEYINGNIVYDRDLNDIFLNIVTTYKENLIQIFKLIFTLQKNINRSLTLDIYKYIHMNSTNDEIMIDDKDSFAKMKDYFPNTIIQTNNKINVFDLLKFYNDTLTSDDFIKMENWMELSKKEVSKKFINFILSTVNMDKYYTISKYAIKHLKLIKTKIDELFIKLTTQKDLKIEEPKLSNDILTYIRFNYKDDVNDLTPKQKHVMTTNPYYNIYIDNQGKNFIITGPKNKGISILNKHTLEFNSKTGSLEPNCSDPYNKYMIDMKSIGSLNWSYPIFKSFDEKCANDKKVFIEITKFDNLIHYGDFTNTFHPIKTNTEIAKILTKEENGIIDKIKTGENVLVIGYGASGAGKTSSLIRYYDKKKSKDEPGVFVSLLNEMAATNIIESEITVNLLELFGTEENGEIIRNTKYIKNLKFELNNGEFSLKTTQSAEIDFKDIWLAGKSRKNLFDEKKNIIGLDNGQLIIQYNYDWVNLKEKKVKGGSYKLLTNLREILQYFVEIIRMVAPTTNNDKSSRSHVLIDIILKLKDKQTNPHLIIGDFAGVENEFICGDMNVIDQYAMLHRTDDEENIYFYQEEYKKHVFVDTYKYTKWNDFITNHPIYMNVNDFDYFYKNFDIIDESVNAKDKNIVNRLKEFENKTLELIEFKKQLKAPEITINNNKWFTLDKTTNVEKLKLDYKNNIEKFETELSQFKAKLKEYYLNHSNIDNIVNIVAKLKSNYENLPDEDISTKLIIKLEETFKNLGDQFKTNPRLDFSAYSNSGQILKDSMTKSPKSIWGKNQAVELFTDKFKTFIETNIKTLIKDINKLKEFIITIDEKFNATLNPKLELFHKFYNVKNVKNDDMVTMNFDNFLKSIHRQSLLEENNDLNETLEIIKHDVNQIKNNNNKYNEQINFYLKQIVEDVNKDIDVRVAPYNQIMQVSLTDPNKDTFLYRMLDYTTKRITDADFMIYIKNECSKRSAEGKFINSELANLRSNIIKSIMNNASNDYSFTSNISSFTKECFDYYCHNTKVCFTNPTNSNNNINNSYIIDQLDESDTQNGENKISKNLNYCVFTVFNITKDREQDPPKIPYVDLTMIKMIISKLELETMNFKFAIIKSNSDVLTSVDMIDELNDINSESISEKINRITAKVNRITITTNNSYENHVFMNENDLVDITKEFQIYNNNKEDKYSMKAYMQHFIKDVRDLYSMDSYQKTLGTDATNVIKLLNCLESYLNNKFDKITQNMFLIVLKYILIFIVTEISLINNLSYLGTLDFTQNMRNGALVDLTCNRYYSSVINRNTLENVYTNKILDYKELISGNTYNELQQQLIQRGGYIKYSNTDISRLDISLNDNYRQRLNNVIFYNIFKFMRWSYYKKHDNIENIDTYIFKDYLMTIILCIILHSMHQNKLAIGVFVDQILSMGMYYKYKDEKTLLLPYYLPFV